MGTWTAGNDWSANVVGRRATRPTAACLCVVVVAKSMTSASAKWREFYNLIRQWYNLTKHAGQLPEAAEKIIN